jgi:hypothetical protein
MPSDMMANPGNVCNLFHIYYIMYLYTCSRSTEFIEMFFFSFWANEIGMGFPTLAVCTNTSSRPVGGWKWM